MKIWTHYASTNTTGGFWHCTSKFFRSVGNVIKQIKCGLSLLTFVGVLLGTEDSPHFTHHLLSIEQHNHPLDYSIELQGTEAKIKNGSCLNVMVDLIGCNTMMPVSDLRLVEKWLLLSDWLNRQITWHVSKIVDIDWRCRQELVNRSSLVILRSSGTMMLWCYSYHNGVMLWFNLKFWYSSIMFPPTETPILGTGHRLMTHLFIFPFHDAFARLMSRVGSNFLLILTTDVNKMGKSWTATFLWLAKSLQCLPDSTPWFFFNWINICLTSEGGMRSVEPSFGRYNWRKTWVSETGPLSLWYGEAIVHC